MNVEQLVKFHGDPRDYPEGTCFVSSKMVCHSLGSTYFVGTKCIEVVSGRWLEQPYQKLSPLMSKEEAVKLVG